MISYGGVPLSILDPQRVQRIERNLTIEGIDEVQDPDWSGLPGGGGTGSISWKQPEYRTRRPVRLGKFLWPRSASRWATGHFLATEAQLDRIRRQAYTGDSRGVIPLDLVIRNVVAEEDPNNLHVITAPMYMLAPRPLFQFEADGADTIDKETGIVTKQGDAGANFYLLTLVDDRYWWWYRSVQIDIATSDTWASLYAKIATELQITLAVDPIPSAYMAPPLDLQSRYDYLPLLLDAIAYSVGQRIVRKWDGTVLAQNADLAARTIALNRRSFNARLHLGGQFNFDATKVRHRDLTPLVPDTVRMVVPVYDVSLRGSDEDPADPCNTACRPDLKTYSNQLAGLNLTAQYDSIIPRRGQKTFRSTAIAWKGPASSGSSDSSGSSTSGTNIVNEADLQALARQLAIDWYKWQVGDAHAVYAGVCPWGAEGFSDFIEITAFPAEGAKASHTDAMVTYVSREQMNDLATEVYHRSTAASGSSGSSSSGSSSSGSSSSGSSSSESSSSQSSSSDGCCHKTFVTGGTASCVDGDIVIAWDYDTIDYFCCGPVRES